MTSTTTDNKRANSALTDNERRIIYANYVSGRAETNFPHRRKSETQKVNDFFARARDNTTPPPTPISTGWSSDGLPHASAAPAAAAAYAFPVHEDSPRVVHHHHNSGVPWWAFFLMNRDHSPAPTSSRNEERRESNFSAWAGILIIAGVAIAPAVIGAFYLLSELWNNLERLYYNEGYLQAGLGLVNIVASLSISAILTNAVLSSAITALAVSAGFANPVSWAFFIMSCVTLFAAGCIHLALQEVIYRSTAHFNKDALHPEEPGRFTITDEQIADIQRRDKKGGKGLDGDKMQNVITAIHHDLTENPSRMTRLLRYSPFFRDAESAEKLKAIRGIRMGGTVNYQTEIERGDSSTEILSFSNRSLR